MNGGGEEFCLTISKSQGEARNIEFWTAISGMLESAQLPKSGAKRGIWNLDLGPSRVLENSCTPDQSGQPPALRPQLNGTVAVVTRRRRRVTSFAFPSGGAPTGASLHLVTSTDSPLQRRRPRRRVRRLRRLRPALPASSRTPLRPCAPRRATGLPTPIATTAAPARVPPGPGRRHVGPDHRLMW